VSITTTTTTTTTISTAFSHRTKSTINSVECLVSTHTNKCDHLIHKHPEQEAFENVAGRFVYHYWVSFFELKASADYTMRDKKKPKGKQCKI
jgi:type 1 glutamine amidotransferase